MCVRERDTLAGPHKAKGLFEGSCIALRWRLELGSGSVVWVRGLVGMVGGLG